MRTHQRHNKLERGIGRLLIQVLLHEWPERGVSPPGLLGIQARAKQQQNKMETFFQHRLQQSV